MKRVLDIGCWAGKRVLRCKNILDIYGADIDTSKFLPEIKDRLFKLDITKPLPKTKPFDKPFDIIYFEEVLEHIEEGNDIIALKNINSLLKKGGVLMLTTPRSISCECWDPAWIRWQLNRGGRHYHYPREELFSKLSRAGFKLERVRVTGNLWWLFCRWINLPLKHIFKSKRLFQAPRRHGYFGWEIIAKKIK